MYPIIIELGEIENKMYMLIMQKLVIGNEICSVVIKQNIKSSNINVQI